MQAFHDDPYNATKVDFKKDRCVLTLAGDADVDFVNAFSKTAQELEKSPASLPLVLDMADVTYMDSSSLGVFIRLLKVYKAKKAKMVIYRPNQALQGIFEATNLAKLITVCETDQDLSKALSPASKKAAGKKKAKRKTKKTKRKKTS